MKLCGILEIDKENKALIKEAKRVIAKNENSISIVQKINNFRMKLAYNKATESLESNFEWTKVYDNLTEILSKNTKT